VGTARPDCRGMMGVGGPGGRGRERPRKGGNLAAAKQQGGAVRRAHQDDTRACSRVEADEGSGVRNRRRRPGHRGGAHDARSDLLGLLQARSRDSRPVRRPPLAAPGRGLYAACGSGTRSGGCTARAAASAWSWCRGPRPNRASPTTSSNTSPTSPQRADRTTLSDMMRIGWATVGSIKQHIEGIVAYVATGLSSARSEGLNGKIRTITRRSFGFHSASSLIALIHLYCGGLTISPFSGDPHASTKPGDREIVPVNRENIPVPRAAWWAKGACSPRMTHGMRAAYARRAIHATPPSYRVAHVAALRCGVRVQLRFAVRSRAGGAIAAPD
jgi:Transposase